MLRKKIQIDHVLYYRSQPPCMLRNNNNSYVNCSEQQAHSRSVTLKYACIIIVIVIIISSSMIVRKCVAVQHCAAVRLAVCSQCARQCATVHLVVYVWQCAGQCTTVRNSSFYCCNTATPKFCN